MDDDINKIIRDLNTWSSNAVLSPKTFSKYRSAFFTGYDYLVNKGISVSISGLRRVGKTTILRQIIHKLLVEKKTDPDKIFYFTFEEDINDIERVLEIYFSRFSQEEKITNLFFIFLDEVQHVKNWQTIIKRYIDLSPDIRFIITGSSSLYIDKDSNESLAGRIIDLRLHPLSFDEFLHLKHGVATHDIKGIFENFSEEEIKKKVAEKRIYSDEVSTYIRFGEYPALINTLEDTSYNNEYLKNSIVEKIFQKDIKVFEIEKTKEIKTLFRVCMGNIGQDLNQVYIASEIGISHLTVKKYLDILENAFLIKQVKNKLKSIKSQEVSQNKVYSTSLNINLNILGIEDPILPSYLAFKGHIIENYVYNSLFKLNYDIYFYRQKNKEIDLVLEVSDRVIPMEIKSTDKVKRTTLNTLFGFMKRRGLDKGFIFYTGEFKSFELEGMIVYAIPFWLL